jgi:dienelactone hydrolase
VVDEIYDVTADYGPEAIGFVSSHPLLSGYIVATVLTFHRSGDWEKNERELDIRSKTAQFPDTTKGIDAVRNLLTEAGIDIKKCAIRQRRAHPDARG